MQSSNKAKPDNFFFNLSFNIIIPAVLLSKGHQWFGWSATITLIVALIFPFFYGLVDFFKERKINPLSVVGLASIFLTGVVGLLHLSKEWIAIKEAAVPLIIGLIIWISMKTDYPLINKLIYNDKIFNIERITKIIEGKKANKELSRLLDISSYVIISSFILSSVLNFLLAKMIIKSETGTEAFTEELGKMTALSYPVIALPSMVVMFGALFYLLRGLKRLTNLSMEDLLNTPTNMKD